MRDLQTLGWIAHRKKKEKRGELSKLEEASLFAKANAFQRVDGPLPPSFPEQAGEEGKRKGGKTRKVVFRPAVGAS